MKTLVEYISDVSLNYNERLLLAESSLFNPEYDKADKYKRSPKLVVLKKSSTLANSAMDLVKKLTKEKDLYQVNPSPWLWALLGKHSTLTHQHLDSRIEGLSVNPTTKAISGSYFYYDGKKLNFSLSNSAYKGSYQEQIGRQFDLASYVISKLEFDEITFYCISTIGLDQSNGITNRNTQSFVFATKNEMIFNQTAIDANKNALEDNVFYAIIKAQNPYSSGDRFIEYGWISNYNDTPMKRKDFEKMAINAATNLSKRKFIDYSSATARDVTIFTDREKFIAEYKKKTNSTPQFN